MGVDSLFNKPILVLATCFLVACGGGSSSSCDNTVTPLVGANEHPVINSFSFLMSNNPSLEADINPVFFGTQEEEVAHIKSRYTRRMDWLTEAFNSL